MPPTDTKQKILDAARNCFNHSGVANVRLQHIADEVINYCRQNLTGYKVPKTVEFRSELPKTNVGKILRRVLRDETKS